MWTAVLNGGDGRFRNLLYLSAFLSTFQILLKKVGFSFHLHQSYSSMCIGVQIQTKWKSNLVLPWGGKKKTDMKIECLSHGCEAEWDRREKLKHLSSMAGRKQQKEKVKNLMWNLVRVLHRNLCSCSHFWKWSIFLSSLRQLLKKSTSQDPR